MGSTSDWASPKFATLISLLPSKDEHALQGSSEEQLESRFKSIQTLNTTGMSGGLTRTNAISGSRAARQIVITVLAIIKAGLSSPKCRLGRRTAA